MRQPSGEGRKNSDSTDSQLITSSGRNTVPGPNGPTRKSRNGGRLGTNDQEHRVCRNLRLAQSALHPLSVSYRCINLTPTAATTIVLRTANHPDGCLNQASLLAKFLMDPASLLLRDSQTIALLPSPFILCCSVYTTCGVR